MARIRTIKPELWTDSKVVALSPLARLLWMGSWNFADDYGCLAADAMQLKLRVLPAEPCNPEALIAELLKAGVLEELVSESNETFWHVTHWEEHQYVEKRSKPVYGLPDTWTPLASPTLPFTDVSPTPPLPLRPGWEGIGMEWNGVANAKRPRKVAGIDEEARVDSNGIWTALEDVFGKAATRTERSLRGKLVKSLAEAGATYTSVKERSAAWSKLFPGRNGHPPPTCTDTALEKWWGALGLIVETGKPPPPCPICDSRRIVGVTEDGEVVKADDPRAVGSERCRCVNP